MGGRQKEGSRGKANAFSTKTAILDCWSDWDAEEGHSVLAQIDENVPVTSPKEALKPAAAEAFTPPRHVSVFSAETDTAPIRAPDDTWAHVTISCVRDDEQEADSFSMCSLGSAAELQSVSSVASDPPPSEAPPPRRATAVGWEQRPLDDIVVVPPSFAEIQKSDQVEHDETLAHALVGYNDGQQDSTSDPEMVIVARAGESEYEEQEAPAVERPNAAVVQLLRDMGFKRSLCETAAMATGNECAAAAAAWIVERGTGGKSEEVPNNDMSDRQQEQKRENRGVDGEGDAEVPAQLWTLPTGAQISDFVVVSEQRRLLSQVHR